MTDEELLNGALRGDDADLEKLYEVCLDRPRAEALARMLGQTATQADESARSWAHVLEEMHPGLKVDLPPAVRPSS